MNFSIDKISDLIAKYATHRLSESEKLILDQWLEDSYNRLQFERILSSYQDKVLLYNKINTQKALQKLKGSKNRKNDRIENDMLPDKNLAEDKSHISNLISKYITSDLNPFEEKYLDSLLQDPDNKLQFDKILSLNNIHKNVEGSDHFIFSNKQDQCSEYLSIRKSTYRWLAYMAVILLPIGMGILAFLMNKDEEIISQPVFPEMIAQSNDVLLQLDNGETYSFNWKDTLVEASSGWLTVDSVKLSYQQTLNKESEELNYNTLVIPRGMQYQLTLSDGTRVWLNAQTRFRYPVVFSGEKREVFLSDGEVYLEVSKNKKQPFIVHVADEQVKVLGTQFNIKAYNNEDENQITLVEGSVLICNDKNTVKLSPDQQAVINYSSHDLQVKNVTTELYCGWRDKMFIYRDTRLEQIMMDLERQYDLKVFYQDRELQEETFSISINITDDFKDIMKMLEATGSVRFDLKDNLLVIKR